MQLRAILFDHDGTLVNSEPVHYRVWAQVLQRYGFTLSEQQYKAHYAGVPTPANAIDLVQRFEIDETPQQLVEAKSAATREYLEQQAFPLMPGVEEGIPYLHGAGLKLAVVTGASANCVQTTKYQMVSDVWVRVIRILNSAVRSFNIGMRSLITVMPKEKSYHECCATKQ